MLVIWANFGAARPRMGGEAGLESPPHQLRGSAQDPHTSLSAGPHRDLISVPSLASPSAGTMKSTAENTHTDLSLLRASTCTLYFKVCTYVFLGCSKEYLLLLVTSSIRHPPGHQTSVLVQHKSSGTAKCLERAGASSCTQCHSAAAEPASAQTMPACPHTTSSYRPFAAPFQSPLTDSKCWQGW